MDACDFDATLITVPGQDYLCSRFPKLWWRLYHVFHARYKVCRAEDSPKPDEGRAGAEAASQAAEEQGDEKVLRHAVFFKFKDGTSDADIQKVVDAFDALPKKIDSIKGYERGTNVSEIGFDDGFTHCFLLSFADEAGRAKYLPHPDHKAFGATLGPHLDKAFVDRFLEHAREIAQRAPAQARTVFEIQRRREQGGG